jgi:putative FmdB family regulatory protein
MPRYNYLCERCDLVFETTHGMSETPKIQCPKCRRKAEKTLRGMTFSFYFPGEGLVRDKAGAKRDMHLHHLTHNDPYGQWRQPGERADLADRLRRGGKHQKHPKVFRSGGLKGKA